MTATPPTLPDEQAPAPADDGLSRPTRLALGVGAVGAATLAWSLAEAQWFTLRHVHVTGVVRHSPTPVRILHISDLHVAHPRGRIGHFIASLADEDYDLVVATGDLLGDQGVEDDVVAMLAPLTASDIPGLVVLGSNDVYGPVARNPLGYLVAPTSDDEPTGPRLDTERLVDGLARQGWTTLRNEATAITTPRGTIVASGIDDPHLRETTLPNPEDIASAVPGILHLGLVHAPYKAALDMLVGVGADVILSGHTHGGQVRVPGAGALTTNCDLPASKARGLSHHRGVPLHVSAGLGTSKYAPIRFLCRPEATLLTLLP